MQHSHSDSSVNYTNQHRNSHSYKDTNNHLNQSFNTHSDDYCQIKHVHHLPTCINELLNQYPDQYPDHDVNIQHQHHHLQMPMQHLNIMVAFKSQTIHHTIILLLFILNILITNCSTNEIQIESFEDLILDSSQRDIFRRWLSEGDSHDAHFKLQQISNHMDEIISKYEEYSMIINTSNTDNDITRRILKNEGEWSCNTTLSILESFENVSISLELFNELNCTHEHEHEEHHSEHVPNGVYIVLYCGFVLFIGVLLKYTQHRFHIPIPYTVLLLICGVMLEVIEMADDDLFGHLNLGFTQVRYANMRSNQSD